MTDMATVAAVGALADPIRMRLFRFVVGRGDAVSREEASEALAISPTKVKFHLERLADEGLLDTEYRRMTGKQGPGAGRPAKLYRRSATEFRVSLPERRYDIMGAILANAVAKTRAGEPLDCSIDSSAYEMGRASQLVSGDDAEHAADGDALARVQAALTALGYEAEVEVDSEAPLVAPGGAIPEAAGEADAGGTAHVLRLRSCPFDALAKKHTALVCGTNVHYVQGMLDATDSENCVAVLEPSPGYCCVAVRKSDVTPENNSANARE